MSKKKKNSLSDLKLTPTQTRKIYNIISELVGDKKMPEIEDEKEYPYVKGHATLLADTEVAETYHLYISLLNSSVKIFRRITVPSNMRLEHLAKIIILAMGWSGEHLSMFQAQGKYYDSHEKDYDDPDWSSRTIDSMAVTVQDVLRKKGQSIKFEYDFGDSWMHQVRLSSIEEHPSDNVTVDSGAGGCPPEDIGGVWGYEEMLECGEITPEKFSLAVARYAVANYVKRVRSKEQKYVEEPTKKATTKRAQTLRILPYPFSISTIRQLHPRTLQPTNVDSDYAKFANDMERALLESDLPEMVLTANALKAIISRVVMYFEDIVADAGMWRAFVRKNQELYGRSYPFYESEGELYVDEPDINAVRLLVWDAFRDFLGYDRVINPENQVVNEIAKMLYDMLESEFEKIPINEAMANYFRKATFANDFYETCNVLKWIFFDCYLTSDARADDIVEEIKTKYTCVMKDEDAYLQAECSTPMFTQVGMLALLPKEWLAMFVGEVGSKEVAQKIADIEATIPVEIMRMTSYDKHSISFETPEDKKIVIERGPSYNISDSKLKKYSGAIGAYAKYDGKWYPNGKELWGDINQIFEKHKQGLQEEEGLTQQQYDHLMESSGGSPLLYFKDARKLKAFLKKEFNADEVKKALSDIALNAEDIAIFAPGPDKPINIMPDVAAYICDPRNPYYDQREAKKYALNIVASRNSVPGVAARYLISHKMLPDAAINSTKGIEYGQKQLQDNMDFFARAYRREMY
jgi:hypothetical protein